MVIMEKREREGGESSREPYREMHRLAETCQGRKRIQGKGRSVSS